MSGRWPGRLSLHLLTVLLLSSGVCGASPAPAPYTIISSLTLPPTFYVGDHVELRVRLKTADEAKLALPAQMPSGEWVRIDSMRLLRVAEGVELRIFLVSFSPGSVTIPPIDLGAFTLRGLTIDTASLVHERGITRITDPKPQMLLPDSTLYLAALIALVIAVPLGLFLVIGRVGPAFSAMIEEHRARRPWRRLLQALSGLEASKARVGSREFYIVLCREVRRYLSASIGSDFSSVTAREFGSTAERRSLDPQSAIAFGAVLSFGDLVKFAGEVAGGPELTRDLSSSRRAAERLEQLHRHNRAEQREERANARRKRGSRRI